MAGLRWDNRFVDTLPVDPSTEIRPRQVVGALSSRVRPVNPSAPVLVADAREVAEELGLAPELWTDHRDLMARVLTGDRLLPGMDPHAANYGGHQFGNWAGQLGDGRAIALGELVTPDGGRQTLQLKGAGPTPYSRGADGFAVLRSSVREFLCSEAMHHLGVPTTRALSLAVTGDKVVRDMFYDGNPRPEPGAIVCRVAPSFIRFGSFQLPASRQDDGLLAALADFTIEEYFADIAAEHQEGTPDRYAAFFAEVARTTLAMVLGWMRVGFVHGVMNTDNLSIHGLTIDYGPYGWLEGFDPGWTPNTTDATHRRYRYGQQPQVAHWNLLQLANALVPLVDATEPLQEAIEGYGADLQRDERQVWRDKVGLDRVDDTAAADELIGELFQLLVRTETDMTIFFRSLADVVRRDDGVEADGAGSGDTIDDATALVAPLADAYYDDAGAAEVMAATAEWLRRHRALAATDGRNGSERAAAMDRVNPRYVLRNYLAQVAIDAAEGDDFAEVERLLDVLRRPYDDQPGNERYAAKRPEWARERPGCSQLSCSS
ncbi:MAG: YdiU family protein [Actinomycetota bacterium]